MRRLFGRTAAGALPAGLERRRIEDLGEPRPRSRGRPLRQRRTRKESRLLDLPVWLALAEHLEIADHVDGDMVATRRLCVEEEAVQDRLAVESRRRPPPRARARAHRGRSRRPRRRRLENASPKRSHAGPAGRNRPPRITTPRTPSVIGRVIRKVRCAKPRSDPGRQSRHARASLPAGCCVSVEAPLLQPVNGGAAPCVPGSVHGLHDRAYHRPAPQPGPPPRPRRVPAQALHGLRQLEARARAAERHDAARRAWSRTCAPSAPTTSR